MHHRGVSTVSGLYFLGLLWLHTRDSALLGWVRRDTEHLAKHNRTHGARAGVPAHGSDKRMSKPKIHHYVPQFLLSEFVTGSRKQLHAFDKQAGQTLGI